MGRVLRHLGCAAGMAIVAVGAAALLQEGQPLIAGELSLSEVSGKLNFNLSKKSAVREDVSGPAAKDEAIPTARENEEPQQRTMTVRPFSFDDSAEGHSVQFSTDAETVRSAAGGAGALMLAPQAEKAAEKAPAAESAIPVKRVPEQPAAAMRPGKAEGSAAGGAKAKPEGRKAAPAKAEKPRAAAERAPAEAREPKKSSQPFERVVTSARFVMEGSLIKLVLRGNSPMVGHFSQLKDPERVVLDLAGNWTIQPPRVPSNRLIQAVRIGQHADKTRLVFDLKTEGKAALVPLTRNSLELHIR